MKYGARQILNEHGQGVELYLTGCDGVEKKATHYDLNHADGIYNQDNTGVWWKWSESAPGVFEFDAEPDGKWDRVINMDGRNILPWGKTIDTVVRGANGLTIELSHG